MTILLRNGRSLGLRAVPVAVAAGVARDRRQCGASGSVDEPLNRRRVRYGPSRARLSHLHCLATTHLAGVDKCKQQLRPLFPRRVV